MPYTSIPTHQLDILICYVYCSFLTYISYCSENRMSVNANTNSMCVHTGDYISRTT